jgi:pimeloyl-ACP methyl ester carboxylesterase
VPLATASFASYASATDSHGLFLSVECHDEFPFNDRADIVRAADQVPLLKSFAMITLPLMACPSWPVGSAAPADRAAATSDLPALIFVGELDPASSVDWAKDVAKRLPRAKTVRFAGIGHGVVAAHACADALLTRFLTDPAKPLFDNCLMAVATASFVHPAGP